MSTKHLRFEEIERAKPTARTRRWSVLSASDGSDLGLVHWRSGWRRYVFEPTNSVFDASCLRELADFLEERTTERQEERRRELAHELEITVEQRAYGGRAILGAYRGDA